ncbi:MAG: hypothetical protein PWP24_407 [Clostridiales bacterium]|nr:hypothetical protein [Clostridiales bacterium]
MEKQFLREIQEEYKKINEHWLCLHVRTAFGLVLFTFLIECVMGMWLYHTGQVNTTLSIYLVKYLLSPFVINMCIVCLTYHIWKSKKLSQTQRIYWISMLFIFLCMVVYCVHVVFPTLFFIFAIPVLLTVIYGAYRLTGLSALSSLAALLISEIFIRWDVDKVSIFEDRNKFASFIISICILIGFSVVCMVVIRFEKQKNEVVIEKELERYKLKQKIQTDELTGIYNRTALREAIYKMEQDTSDNCYVLAMIDLDDFKKLNDQFGHMEGDRCLVLFGEILKKNCGQAIPFRYGGDEFCILFQNQTIEEVKEICQRIQADLEQANLKEKFASWFTASFGISCYQKNSDSAQLFINTDKALYQSKETKNTIRIHYETN